MARASLDSSSAGCPSGGDEGPVGRWGDREAGILAVAERAFAERGHDRVTMAEIARLAGLAEGTVYNYFSSKKQLILTVANRRFATSTERLRAELAAQEELRDRLRSFIRHHLAGILDDVATYQFVMREVRSKRGYDKSPTRALFRRYASLLSSTLKEAVERRMLAHPLPVPIMRDMVIGSAEHVARTAILRGHFKPGLEPLSRMLADAHWRAFGGEVPTDEGGR